MDTGFNGQMNRAMLLMLHTLNAVWNNDALIVFVIFTSDGWFASHRCFYKFCVLCILCIFLHPCAFGIICVFVLKS